MMNMKLTSSTSQTITKATNIFVIDKFQRLLMVALILSLSFSIYAQPNVVVDIDTNPTDANTSSVSQANDMYQSFTPTQDGRLVRIDLIVRANSVGTKQLDVFDGEGTTGTLLHTQSVTSQVGSNEYELSVPIPVTGGQLYTFALTDTDPALLVGTPYGGGKLMVTFNGNPFEFDADFKVLLDIGTNTNLVNQGDFTNENPIVFDLGIFGNVVGLELNDFQVTNGMASSLIEDTPGNYSLEVIPNSENLISVVLPTGVATIDGLDNDITMASTTYDITSPDNQNTIFTNSGLFTAGGQVLFNDPSVTPLVFLAPEGTTEFTSSTMINAPTTAGTYKLFVLDEAGNVSEASEATLFVTSETDATSSIISLDNNNILSGDIAEITFFFLGSVTDFTNADLTIPNGTLTDVVSTDGNRTFNATFTPDVDVVDETNVIAIDLTGITNGVDAGTGTVSSDNFAIDTGIPKIESIQCTDGCENIYSLGSSDDVIVIEVNFDREVIVTGAPVLALELGEIDGVAVLDASSISGASQTFSVQYTVASGDFNTDLDYTGITALTLPSGATIVGNSNGTTANLTLAVPGEVGSISENRDVYVDLIAPTITSIMRQDPVEETTGENQVTFRVVFSEEIDNSSFGSDDFTLSGTAAEDGAIEVAQMINATTYDYTVTGLENSNGTIGLDYSGSLSDLLSNNFIVEMDPSDAQSYTLFNVVPTFESDPIATVDQGAEYTYEIEIASNLDGLNYEIEATSVPDWLTFENANIINTIAGDGDLTDDGVLALEALLSRINSLAYDHNGNTYISTLNRIQRIGIDNTITTIAGNGIGGFSGDGGPATDAQFDLNAEIAVDGEGNLYVADRQNYRIRKIDTNGTITTVAGTGVNAISGTGDGGLATAAEIGFIDVMDVDHEGNIYFNQGNQIRKIDTNGMISTIIGSGSFGSPTDGQPASEANFFLPTSIAVDRLGNIFLSLSGAIYRVDAQTHIINLYAGTNIAGFSGDGGLATLAMIDDVSTMTLDGEGNLFFSNGNRLRYISRNGIINTLAGNGSTSLSGANVNALEAGINTIDGISITPNGQLVFADLSNLEGILRSIQTNQALLSGTPNQSDVGNYSITLTASNGVESVMQDFTITVSDVNDLPELIGAEQELLATQGIAFDQVISFRDIDGDLVDIEVTTSPTWLTTEVEANLFTFTSGGAFSDIAFNDDVFYVSDLGTNAIFTTNQLGENLTRLAGPDDGSSGFLNGDLSTALFDVPFAIDVAPNGDLYVIDQGNHALRKISNNMVSTIAGNGAAGFTDGPCSVTLATFDTPNNLLIAPNGDIYISDAGNGVIRILTEATGEITTLQDAGGSNITFDSPYGLALDGNGVLYVTDNGGHTVWSIDENGAILLAGEQGTFGHVDGTAAEARFDEPAGIVTNADGSLLYVAEATGNVRKIEIDENNSTVSTLLNTADTPVGLLINPVNNALLYGDVGVSSIIEVQFSIGLSGTPTNGDVGTNEVNVSLNDGASLVEEVITINVANVNDAPEFTSIAPTSILEDALFSYIPEGEDIDGDELIFSAVTIPDWLSFSNTSGPVLAGNPSQSDIGEHMITLQVSDGELVAEQSFTLEVINVTKVIEVTSGLFQTFGIGDEIQFQVGFDGGGTNVSVGGNPPTITLETGDVDRTAVFSGGSEGTDNMIFTYVVQEGDFSDDLDYNVTAIDAGIGTQITSNNGNDVNLSLPDPGSASSLSGTSAIVIDGILPLLTTSSVISNNSLSSDIATVGDIITVAFTASEALGTVPEVNLGGVSIPIVATSNSNEYEGTIVVAEETFSEGTVNISIELEDLVGNQSISEEVSSTIIDTVSPEVDITISSNDASFIVIFTFSEPVVGFTVEDLIFREIGGAAIEGGISDFSGSGTTYSVTFEPSTVNDFEIVIEENVATDAAGNSNQAAEERESVLSIDNIDTVEEVTIFPNPAQDVLNIEWEEYDPSTNKELIIFNQSGQLVYHKQLISYDNISINNLKSGLYLLQIVSDVQIITRRFVISK